MNAPKPHNLKWKPDMEKNEIEQLWEDYGWTIFPLLLAILLLLVPRLIVWIMAHVNTFHGETKVTFLKVTKI